MSQIYHPPKQEPSWYTRGWDAFDNNEALGDGLYAMHINGEPSLNRRYFKQGWRDALVVSMCDTTYAPRWMKQEMGI